MHSRVDPSIYHMMNFILLVPCSVDVMDGGMKAKNNTQSPVARTNCLSPYCHGIWIVPAVGDSSRSSSLKSMVNDFASCDNRPDNTAVTAV